MKRRRGTDEDKGAALDITSTIDVVFLLLIFFIATIRLPEPEANIRAYLPKEDKSQAAAGSAAEPEETKDETVIRVTMRGARTLQLNGAPVTGGYRELDTKLGALKRVAVEGVETKVVLDAGPQVPYRFVVNALDICAKHEFKNISFAIPEQS